MEVKTPRPEARTCEGCSGHARIGQDTGHSESLSGRRCGSSLRCEWAGGVLPDKATPP